MRAWFPPRAKPAQPADWRDLPPGWKRVRCFEGGCFADSVVDEDFPRSCPACGGIRIVLDRPRNRREARA